MKIASDASPVRDSGLKASARLLGYGWLFGLSGAIALVAVLTLGDGARAPARTSRA